MMSTVENLVLKNLLNDEEYLRKTLPFVKPEYFSSMEDRVIFQMIFDYFSKYNSIPSKEALEIEAGHLDNISDDQHKKIIE